MTVIACQRLPIAQSPMIGVLECRYGVGVQHISALPKRVLYGGTCSGFNDFKVDGFTKKDTVHHKPFSFHKYRWYQFDAMIMPPPASRPSHYCVFTSPSASTVQWSLVARVKTALGGNSTLAAKSVMMGLDRGKNAPIRDGFNQLGLVRDLPALFNGLFLCSG